MTSKDAPAPRVLPWILVVLTLLGAALTGTLAWRRWQALLTELEAERAVLAQVGRALDEDSLQRSLHDWLAQVDQRENLWAQLPSSAQWRARSWWAERAAAQGLSETTERVLRPLLGPTAPPAPEAALEARTLCQVATLENDDPQAQAAHFARAMERAEPLQGQQRVVLVECLLGQVHAALAQRRVGAGVLDMAARAEAELEHLASTLDPETARGRWAEVLYARAVVLDQLGEWAGAAVAYQAVLALDAARGVGSGDAHAAVLAAYASVLGRAGQWRLAVQHYALAAQASHSPLAVADRLHWVQLLLWLEQPQLALETVQQIAPQLASLAPVIHSEFWRLQAEARLQQADAPAARAAAAQAIEVLEPSLDHDYQRSRVQLSQTLIALATDGPGATDAFLLPALAWAQRTEVGRLHPELLAAQAEVELAGGDAAAALRAADRAELQMAKLYPAGHPRRLRIQHLLARCQWQSGDSSSARTTLHAVRAALEALADPELPLWRTQRELESALAATP